MALPEAWSQARSWGRAAQVRRRSGFGILSVYRSGLAGRGASTRRRLYGQFLDPGGFEGCCSSHLLDGYFVGRCSVLWLRLLRPGLLTEEDKNAHSQDEHQDRGLRSSGLVNRACRWCSYVVARKTKASCFQSLRWCPGPPSRRQTAANTLATSAAISPVDKPATTPVVSILNPICLCNIIATATSRGERGAARIEVRSTVNSFYAGSRTVGRAMRGGVRRG